MDEAFLKILFEKFTQEDESIARSYSGTGLGMSISKHLVELMGGTIDVKSAKRVGTTFNLNLFFDEGVETDLLKDEVETANLDDLKNKEILLVEDNEMNQLVAKTILEQNGMKVQVASNGIEAIQQVQSQHFDLVLMDMQMPVMDGLKATRIIRETHKLLPIVALTANALKGEQAKCTNAGMNDFLTKPFEEKILLNMLCKWLGKAKEKSEQKVSIEETISKVVESQPLQLYSLEKVQAISPGNQAFLKMLLEVFINDAGGTALKIKDAFLQKDYRSIKQLAHRIKPSIDQLQIPYHAQIRRMEELSLIEDATGELETLVTEFDSLMMQVTTSLKNELQ
jgi:CheY-like chemotaxis protein